MDQGRPRPASRCVRTRNINRPALLWEGESAASHPGSAFARRRHAERHDFLHREDETMQQTPGSSTGMSGPQPGTFNVQDARQMMISGLRNAHGLEQQAIEML